MGFMTFAKMAKYDSSDDDAIEEEEEEEDSASVKSIIAAFLFSRAESDLLCEGVFSEEL